MSTATPAPNDAVSAIRALEAEFQRHANANDAAALTEAFYTDDAQLLPPNAPQVNGKPAIRDFWKAFLAVGVSDVVLETGNASSSGDLAYGVGKYGFTAAGARHSGKYVVVYRRQSNGSYRAVADACNSNA
jgi:ketosteroid isomerase-like protein